MKKILFVICLMFISISNVFALTDEEELQNLIDKVPDSYDFTIENDVSLVYKTTDLIEFYIWNKMIKTLEDEGYDFTGLIHKYALSIEKKDTYLYTVKLSDAGQCYNDVGKYYYTCDETISVSKNIKVNITNINDDSKKQMIENIYEELNQINEFSDFSNHIQWIKPNVLTTLKKIESMESEYNIKLEYYGFRGSGVENDNLDIELSWNTSHAYIFIDNKLYSVNQIDIFKCEKSNGYRPKIELGNYDDVDKYIDDALVDFPSKAHLTNYEVVTREDGLRYSKRTEDGTDYYEVLIKDLDDNVEWTMYFNGKLKEKEKETNIKGDMNNNGKIDLKDIIILIRKYLGLE